MLLVIQKITPFFSFSVEMDEKVDLVEVLTRRVEELQRGMHPHLWYTRLSFVFILLINPIILLFWCLLYQFSVDQLGIL